MDKLILWLIGTGAGIAAWYVAVFGEKLSSWPSLGCWIAFWVLLGIYQATERARRSE